MSRLLGILVLVMVGGCGAQAQQVPSSDAPRWVFAPADSKLMVQVFRDQSTYGSELAHDHVIAAQGWSGSARIAPQSPASGCQIDVSVPVSGLVPDLPELRKLVGYDVMLTDAQRQQVGEHMRGEDQLNAAKFSNIRFSSTDCKASGDRVLVTGDLELHGVKKRVIIPLKLSVVEGRLRGVGNFRAGHADFGMSPYSAMLGALKNREELVFTLDVVADPAR